MTKMTMRSSSKPPLARSPIRIRPRRVLQPISNAKQTPPGSLTKSQKPKRAMDIQELDLRPEYKTISCELKRLAKMVQEEFGNKEGNEARVASSFRANSGALFERGRFYEEYTARRNERLKRKKHEMEEEKEPVYDHGVRVESVKRRGETKKSESIKKMVPSTPMTERREAASSSRYLLRSITGKESKKPPLATPSAGIGRSKTAAKKVRKI